MVFDRSARQVTIDGTAVEFPNREYRLLEIFLGSLGRVLSKADLAEQLFGFDDEAGPNAIELYVARLRKRLNGTPVSIRTLRGLGYVAALQSQGHHLAPRARPAPVAAQPVASVPRRAVARRPAHLGSRRPARKGRVSGTRV